VPPSSFEAIELLLRENGAIRALKDLIAAGCDRGVLLSLLHVIHSDFPGLDTQKTRTGLDSSRLKLAIKRFRQVADEIEAINQRHFGLELLPPSPFTELRNLPGQLRKYSKLLAQKPLKSLGRYPGLHAQKYYLTQYVIECSHYHKPHDEKVAAIIDAALPSEKRSHETRGGSPRIYDATAHKQWRFKNYAKLSQIFAGK